MPTTLLKVVPVLRSVLAWRANGPAHHRPPGPAVRVRRRHPRLAAAAHAVLAERGRTLARGAGVRAGRDRLPVARARRDHGQARLLRTLRTAPDAGRTDHERPARELAVAQVRGPGLRRDAVGRLARGMLAVRGVPGLRARSAGRHRLRRLPAVAPA